jgi:DNA topoisomerase-2
MKIKEYFDKEVRQFSIANCERSIPSVYDGFKPSQRKAIFGALHRGENADFIKVSQLTAHCAAVSAYHHGEGSMAGAIIGMSQNFTGANNYNWFTPDGQFGSRLSPVAGATRYIFTKLDENFRKIFLKEDDIILQQINEENKLLEPINYIPLLPGSLINGSEGMGTGYATKILAYNPKDLIDSIVKLLNNKSIEDFLVPWYKGFKGKIERNKEFPTQTIIQGDFEIIDANTIRVFELPVGTYQDQYCLYLNKLMETKISKDQACWIKDYTDDSTEQGFEFILDVPRDVTKMDRAKLLSALGLVSKDSENYTLWLDNGKIRVYENTRAIITDFVEWRLQRYEERRTKKISLLEVDINRYSERKRFIELYIQNNWSTTFSKIKKADIEKILTDLKFENTDDLLSIKIYNLTMDEINKLNKKIEELNTECDVLRKSTPKDIYLKELQVLKGKL